MSKTWSHRITYADGESSEVWTYERADEDGTLVVYHDESLLNKTLLSPIGWLSLNSMYKGPKVTKNG